MKDSLTKLLKRRVRREKKYFAQPQKYARQIKKLAQQELDSPQIYLFGSVARGQATPGSDIDLLIVSASTPKTQAERARIKAHIYQALDPFAPFEIHLITPAELNWYQRFINQKIPI